jgi:hypothetical protein
MVFGCSTIAPFFFGRAGDGKRVAIADGQCVELVPEYALHRVRACENKTHYFVEAPGRTLTVAKDEFRTRLRDGILQFTRATPYPWLTLRDARIEVWITTGIVAPAEAAFVAVVLSEGGNFLVRLPIEPDEWTVAPEHMAFLGKARYPSRLAKRVGALALQPRPGATPASVAAALAESGVLARSAAAGWAPVLLKTAAFGEPLVARQVMVGPLARQAFQTVDYLPDGEREGAKALAYVFAFDPQRQGELERSAAAAAAASAH